MAAGAFFSGLIGTYAGQLRQKHAMERARDEKSIDDQIDLIKLAVSTGQADVGAAADRIDELLKSKKGGKGGKGGFSLKNLIGEFQDLPQSPGAGDRGANAPAGGGAYRGGDAGVVSRGSNLSPSEQATLTEGERPPAPTLGAVPQRPGGQVFKSRAQLQQEKLDEERQEFEQVIKPQLDYTHQQRLDEIQAQYGGRLTPRTKVLGSSVPPNLPTDIAGKPIDPTKPYTVMFDRNNQAVGAVEEYERPASTRATGPEAKVESLAKDIIAEAELQGRPISKEQAEQQARVLMLRQSRATLLSTLENVRGKQFANRVRAELEKGVMTPATARSVISYVATEANRRFHNDMDTIMSGKTVQQLEDDIFGELGTSRDEVSGFLRAGAKPKVKFDKNLNPIPARPAPKQP